MKHEPEHTTHVVPLPIYFAVFLTLLIFTGLTVWASYKDFGPLSTIIAVTIAVIKATLVVLYFMHLRYSDRLNWVVVIAGFVWLGILLGITLSDYYTRDWIPGF
jgi:cytochrome c oxidase subunit IV